MFGQADDGFDDRDPRIGARIGRIGFFLAGVGMALASSSHLLASLARLGRSRFLRRILQSEGWDWAISTPAALINVFAALVLIGLRTDRSWRTRALALALLQTYFLAYWCGAHAHALGLPAAPGWLVMDDWTFALGRVLGFAAVLTLAVLAYDVTEGLGWVDAEAIYRTARGTAFIGLLLWFLFAMRVFRWSPWPPHFGPIRDVETFYLFNASFVCRSIAGFFATALCGKACILSNRELTRLEAAILDRDPFAKQASESR